MTSRAWDGIDTSPRTFGALLEKTGAGRRILAADWSKTPLGPLDDWPASLRQIVVTMIESGQPMALWYGPELTTIFNDAFVPILGLRIDDAMGRPFASVWPEVFESVLPMVRQALSGETVWMEDLPLQMTRNGFDEDTWWTFSYSPVRDGDGRIAGFLDVVTETTAAVTSRRALEAANASLAREVEATRVALEARQEAERQQAVLQRELIHRMKNMLAIVQSIVSQSLRNAKSIDEAHSAIIGRISSFARAQDIFHGAGLKSASLHDMAKAALETHADLPDRFQLSGPAVEIAQQQATWYVLALYELATNAVKYGALSTPTGRVDISWSLEGDRLSLEWREHGGPRVVRPARTGFGSRLTERVIPVSLGGAANIEWREDGLRYTLSAKLAPADDAPAEEAPVG